MKKILALLFLALLSCGDEKTLTVAVNTGGSEKEVAAQRRVTAQAILHEMETGEYREGELLVKFKSGTVSAASAEVHHLFGARVMKRLHAIPNLEHVKLPDDVPVRDAVVAYMSDPRVEYAEPNYKRKFSETVPDDESFRFQWALRNTGQIPAGTVGADIKATFAWDFTKGSRDIIVAVVDTGIDYSHPDLRTNMWVNTAETNCTDSIDDDRNGFIDDCIGWDFASGDNDPADDNGHGTHVAGIIGAAGNNGIGVSGVMWNVQLMPVKFLDRNGVGFISDEAAAISYAITKGAKVINASFSGGQFSNTELSAITAARNAGVLVVAASGNEGNQSSVGNNDLVPVYPAGYALDNVISVSATDQRDQRAVFSNFGPNSVHVAAPGVFIFSTVPGGYAAVDGTSMSTAFVSGLAGLLFDRYRELDYSRIRGLLLKYVDVVPSFEGLIFSGGRINALHSLRALLPPSGLSARAPFGNRVELSWSDDATGEDGYLIERRSGDGAFTRVATTDRNATSYTDAFTTVNTAYTYRVRALSELPLPPGSGTVQGESIPAFTTVATPSETAPADGDGGKDDGGGGGGGGGCSVAALRQDEAIDPLLVILPLAAFLALSLRRKKV